MIGVIADDLTGAAEIGAIGLRYGLRAEIIVVAGSEFRLQAAWHGRPAEAGTPNANLLCIDTDSRVCAPREAARRAAAAAKLLRRAGAQWIYKKVDSVLRGNVMVEIKAMARALDCRRILLHPANPSLGRTIRDGNYFIHGKPIHKTEFARDPAHPRWTADVCALLECRTASPIQVSKPRDPLPDKGVVICEASSPRDVRLWAGRADSATLLAGGGEFFAALLAARLGAPAARRRVSRRPVLKLAGEPPALPAVRELFVCGSTSESSKKFIGAARRAGTPVFSLPGKVAGGAGFPRATAKAISEKVGAAFQANSRVILQIGLRTVHEASVARRLSGYLTQLAEVVLRHCSVSSVFVEGGATAVELVRRMGWPRLAVLREVSPGVATLAVDGGKTQRLTVKPGTYVWPQEILNSTGADKSKLL